ncbi:MAG: glycoside hydrolase family 25 protein [Lachnospiraceae bacterium]|nr:glycoside hydrolase family 25 protein [Lachnospiraceae bacterium]
MDSKVKHTAIFVMFLMIVMILGVVVYTNLDTVKRRFLKEEESAQTESADSEWTGAEVERVTGQIGNDLSAFMQDETFFNSQSTLDKYRPKGDENRLSIVVTSIEQDLRVQVVNYEGVPVEGESFYIMINGEDEYKDLDQDGVVYIADLKPGEYYVSLSKVSGYKVPENPTKVRVKDKVEYVAIDDISLLIKTEDEINAAIEDTAVNGADEDADNTEMTSVRRDGNAKFGIDVSKWNGEIDWDKVKEAGVEYAIIRLGYRGSSTGALVEDPYFEKNIRGAIASDIPVGVYFFTQATNEVEAVEEASMVIKLCSDYKLDYPVFIDTESAGGNGRADGLGQAERTLVCRAFCSTIKNAGYKAGVYASRNWLNNNLISDRLEQDVIWLAEYRETPLYQGYYQMWQYSSNGKIDGIEGRVDINLSYLE